MAAQWGLGESGVLTPYSLVTDTRRGRLSRTDRTAARTESSVSRSVPRIRHRSVLGLRRILWMARDRWVEKLRCPNCRRAGIAQLSATDEHSWEIQMDGVPEGFKVVGQNIAATFIALRAIAQWNRRVCKGASVGGRFHVSLTTAHRPKRGPVARSNLAGSMPLVAPTPDDAALVILRYCCA